MGRAAQEAQSTSPPGSACKRSPGGRRALVLSGAARLYCMAWAQRFRGRGKEMPERERMRALRHQRGQRLVGYALLMLFVAIAMFAILALLGPAIGC